VPRRNPSNYTTVSLNKATRARLDKERDPHLESYDDVINKILDQAKKKGHCKDTDVEAGSRIREEAENRSDRSTISSSS